MGHPYTLYLVTDRSLAANRSLVSIVREAVAGGVSCVQLREKDISTRKFVEEARLLLTLLRPLAIPLIINDRVDVAVAAGADGVHLGQSDMHLQDARKILGPKKIIGISAESLGDALQAERDGADYIGISPVFHTSTKDDIASPLGLSGVAEIRTRVTTPLVGIGGISAANAADVIMAGADGVAVVSAIVCAPSPARAAAHLLAQIHHISVAGKS